MRSPSARVLINRVDIYLAVQGTDADGGPKWTYPSLTRQQVACSVQYLGTDEIVDELDRVTVVNSYQIMFGSSPGLNPRDKIQWNDETPRTLFVRANPASEAGRNAAFVVRAIEYI